jgi:hypothetical protein
MHLHGATELCRGPGAVYRGWEGARARIVNNVCWEGLFMSWTGEMRSKTWSKSAGWPQGTRWCHRCSRESKQHCGGTSDCPEANQQT